MRQDTVTQDTVSLKDTTHVHTISFRTDTALFSIVVSKDSIHAGWTTLILGIPSSTYEPLEHIPRFPTPFADTLKLENGAAVYVNQVGLTEYNLFSVTYTQNWTEWLRLASNSFRE